MPERTWTIEVDKQGNGKFRAFCPLKGCYDWREHANANTAAKFITGHLVAQHADKGVRPSDTFRVKVD